MYEVYFNFRINCSKNTFKSTSIFVHFFSGPKSTPRQIVLTFRQAQDSHSKQIKQPSRDRCLSSTVHKVTHLRNSADCELEHEKGLPIDFGHSSFDLYSSPHAGASACNQLRRVHAVTFVSKSIIFHNSGHRHWNRGLPATSPL